MKTKEQILAEYTGIPVETIFARIPMNYDQTKHILEAMQAYADQPEPSNEQFKVELERRFDQIPSGKANHLFKNSFTIPFLDWLKSELLKEDWK